MSKKKKIKRPAAAPADTPAKAAVATAPAAPKAKAPTSSRKSEYSAYLTKFRTDLLEMDDKTWFRWAAGVAALGTFLRLWDLLIRPVHHDEGVNGWFLTNLIRDNMPMYWTVGFGGAWTSIVT